MLRFLDPRFHLVAALIDDPAYSAEAREIARQQAETIAAACGFTFAEALRHAGFRLRPDAVLPLVAKPLPVDDPVADDDDEVLDDDGVGRKGGAVMAFPSPDGAQAVSPTSTAAPPPEPMCHNADRDADGSEIGGRIAEALKADPGRSDRDVARECDVSPTTVGRVRKALGLSKAVRSVVRGGVAYAMDVRGRS